MVRSCGSSLRQMSLAAGQRVWNLQPDGGNTGDGGSPSIAVLATASVGSGTGIEFNNTCV